MSIDTFCAIVIAVFIFHMGFAIRKDWEKHRGDNHG